MARPELPDYPWDLMTPYREIAARQQDGLLDLSIGSPVDSTPELIRQALSTTTDAHAYPLTVGTPVLREAIVVWFARRRRVPGLTLANVLPTIGSKELVALLPFLLGLDEKSAVIFPRIAYPSYEIGAALVGARPVASDDPTEWPDDAGLIWLNTPSNPDGRVLSVAQLKAAVARAREIGAVLVSDECYAELGWTSEWQGRSTPSLLDPEVTGGDIRNLLVAYSLSKQSNLAGYRAALVAGDEDLVAELTKVRKHAGLMMPKPLQAAMTVALGDDEHVAIQRERYRARREQLIAGLSAAGYQIEGSDAGLYLWATKGRDAWQSVAEFAERGIVVGPGVFYGDHSPNFVRLAFTATDDAIQMATDRLVRG